MSAGHRPVPLRRRVWLSRCWGSALVVGDVLAKLWIVAPLVASLGPFDRVFGWRTNRVHRPGGDVPGCAAGEDAESPNWLLSVAGPSFERGVGISCGTRTVDYCPAGIGFPRPQNEIWIHHLSI